MQLIDSHAHIYLKEFKDDLNLIIDRAKEAGVEAIFMPNIDHTSIEDMLYVADKFPGYCIPMMGLHPCSVTKNFEQDLYEVETLLSKGGFVAVGEIGADPGGHGRQPTLLGPPVVGRGTQPDSRHPGRRHGTDRRGHGVHVRPDLGPVQPATPRHPRAEDAQLLSQHIPHVGRHPARHG